MKREKLIIRRLKNAKVSLNAKSSIGENFMVKLIKHPPNIRRVFLSI